jgi:hypothetical protein
MSILPQATVQESLLRKYLKIAPVADPAISIQPAYLYKLAIANASDDKGMLRKGSGRYVIIWPLGSGSLLYIKGSKS